MITSIAKKKLSVKSQTIGAIVAIFSAVILPRIIHILGTATGLGTSLGEMLLPMHLPIILAGLLAGPFAAGTAGLLSPLISFAMTGMPTSAMLPFMIIELAVYGVCAGMLKDAKISDISKVFIAQLAGRIIRGAAILIGFYGMGTAVRPEIIFTSVKIGIAGIILQLVIIPLAVSRLKNADNE
jgi:hypothetical protein